MTNLLGSSYESRCCLPISETPYAGSLEGNLEMTRCDNPDEAARYGLSSLSEEGTCWRTRFVLTSCGAGRAAEEDFTYR